MIVEACGATHTGNLRKHNEDNIYLDGSYKEDLSIDNTLIRSQRTEGPYTYAVFDGLGGEERGEEASLMAAIGLRTMEDRGIGGDIDTYISVAHQAEIMEASRINAANMGTTAVIAHIEGDRATISNVGDSRAYLWRDEKLMQVSKDHNVYQLMLDAGFSAATIRQNEQSKSLLTQYIGMPSDEDIKPAPFTSRIDLRSGDILLLCSDGLNAEISDGRISEILSDDQNRSAEYIAVELINTAVESLGRDNISVIVCIVK